MSHRWLGGRSHIGRVKSRTCAMNRSTTGLNVRFFSVTIATGHGRTGKSTGSTFSENRSAWGRATELGNVVMKWPEATILVRRCTDKVIKLILGVLNPRARNASDTIL